MDTQLVAVTQVGSLPGGTTNLVGASAVMVTTQGTPACLSPKAECAEKEEEGPRRLSNPTVLSAALAPHIGIRAALSTGFQVRSETAATKQP